MNGFVPHLDPVSTHDVMKMKKKTFLSCFCFHDTIKTINTNKAATSPLNHLLDMIFNSARDKCANISNKWQSKCAFMVF